jgi:hypothetical protein
VHSEYETRAHSQAPWKSLKLYAPVPARFDVHFSVYSVSCFFLGA